MSPRRKTEPSTHVSSRSARSGRSGLIAKGKTEKQSVKRRTALDNRFHRTDLTLSCATRGPRAEAVRLNLFNIVLSERNADTYRCA